jgi:hypothetical protein
MKTTSFPNLSLSCKLTITLFTLTSWRGNIARSTQLSITQKVAHENMHRKFKTLKMRLQSHFIGMNL